MIIVTSKQALANALTGKTSVGFVPTMGALHEGHLALVKKAKEENEIVCVSIFVNPIQFNNPDDLKKYPREMDKDYTKLEKTGCDIVFAPTENEMYPEKPTEKYNFGTLETVMEGKFRPGHFNGVAIVVGRLFDLINPQKAYFGEKDYQQLQIIKALVKQRNMAIEIVPCPIFREKDGLAMSSRNALLDENARKIAPILHKVLKDAKEMADTLPFHELSAWVVSQLKRSPSINLEYFEIVDPETLTPVQNFQPDKQVVACIAATIGGVRLIDNLKF